MDEPQYYWEDFKKGDIFEFGGKTVTREEVIEFASEFDPQPFHLDEDAAKHSLLGGLAASGWHSCAIIMRMIADNLLSKSAGLGAPGVDEVRWRRPVRPGYELTLKGECVGTRPSSSRPELGIVNFKWDLFNQHDEHLVHMEYAAFFRRRTPGTKEA